MRYVVTGGTGFIGRRVVSRLLASQVDGPYYFFGVLAKLAVLPSFTPILLPDTGRTNIVPVDYVADALVALLHADGLHADGLDGRASAAADAPRRRTS